MLGSNSESRTAPSLFSDNHESDEISSINEYQDTLHSYFSKISQFEYSIPQNIDSILTTLEFAFNDCFKINQEKSIAKPKNRVKISH